MQAKMYLGLTMLETTERHPCIPELVRVRDGHLRDQTQSCVRGPGLPEKTADRKLYHNSIKHCAFEEPNPQSYALTEKSNGCHNRDCAVLNSAPDCSSDGTFIGMHRDHLRVP